MAFKLGRINFNAVAQGVGGLVFGSGDHSSQEDDGGVEYLLERISNGVLAEDRRAAMADLQDVVVENRSAQLAFGAMGLPVMLSVLREERNDLDLVRGALETLINALNTTETLKSDSRQVQPGLINSELLSREPAGVSLLLSLLEEEDFYVRYYTLKLLTALLTNCSARLQEAILTTPQGVTRLMDMLQEREVIRNEALLLLTFLTRAAEEIQKIVVFEGAFEKIFNIIQEEGGSDGGIVVKDCLELLNNLIRNNPSNQIFLRETFGLQPVASLLKLRKSSNNNYSQQKTVNLLCALETIALLLACGPDTIPGKDPNVTVNQTILAQNKLLDSLLWLSVEGRIATVDIRCAALRCIGDLILGHSGNRDVLANQVIGEEPAAEPALNAILRLLLNSSNTGELLAAEYIFECFCEGNPEGQIALASTITFNQSTLKGVENEKHMSFGSILVRALQSDDAFSSLEVSRRAATVLTYILNNNIECKEKLMKKLDQNPVLRDHILELVSEPKSKAIYIPPRIDQNEGESIEDYVIRLRSLLEEHAQAIQDLMSRNSALDNEQEQTKGKNDDVKITSNLERNKNENNSPNVEEASAFRTEFESLKQQLEESHFRLRSMTDERQKLEADALMYRQLAAKHEADLQSLSSAYNSLEQENYRLEVELKNVRNATQGRVLGLNSEQLKAAKEEGRLEAQKESEAELNDLLVCLGQEENKVEKLRTRLIELGEDVDALLEAVGDEEEED